MPSIVIDHPTATDPQIAFWQSKARFRMFGGGIGSGKTRAGIMECFWQAAGSRIMVVAPTFPMLRDSTRHDFLELARPLGLLMPGTEGFNKTENLAKLVNGTEILFRSADEPEHLRGPNLDAAWLDEGRLMTEATWLVVLGRRISRAWITTSPGGGKQHWIYRTFDNDSEDYAIIQAPTSSNPYNPLGWLESVQAAYTSTYARQELGGEWVDFSGGLFKREWFSRIEPHAPSGLTWCRYYDLALKALDVPPERDQQKGKLPSRTATCAVALAPDGTLWIRDMIADFLEWPEQEQMIVRLMQAEPSTQHGVEAAMHGLAAVQALDRRPELAAVILRAVTVDRDKVSRAMSWAAKAERGKVALVAGPWVQGAIEEWVAFDGTPRTWSDRVDAVSGGVQMLGKWATKAAGGVLRPVPRVKRLDWGRRRVG